MADGGYILSPLLCFLVKRYCKLEVRVLKTVLSDFFKPEDVSEAKCQLKLDVEGIETRLGLSGMPRIPRRIDSEHKTVHEIDDIISLLTFVDEKKVMDQLPRYVADSPDSMPYLRIVDSDYRLLWERMDKMQAMLGDVMAAVYNLYNLPNAVYNQSSGHQGVINKPSMVSLTTVSSVGAVSGKTPVGGDYLRSDYAGNVPTLGHSSETADQNSWGRICQSLNETVSFKPQQSQAARRQVTLEAEDTENDGEGAFQPGSSQNHRRRQQHKRRRTRSRDNRRADQQEYTTDDVTVDESVHRSTKSIQQSSLKSSQPVRRLIGKKRADSIVLAGAKLVAAKPYLGKEVFCIDNVSTDVTVDDLSQYVRDMGVNVITCYKVKPRRSPWQRQSGIIPTDRNTFRLCVDREDVDRLLNDENWPEHISISSWIFLKSRQRQSTSDEIGQSPNSRQKKQFASTTAVDASSGRSGLGSAEDMDATIITQQHGEHSEDSS